MAEVWFPQREFDCCQQEIAPITLNYWVPYGCLAEDVVGTYCLSYLVSLQRYMTSLLKSYNRTMSNYVWSTGSAFTATIVKDFNT